jgi:predicted amidohydrolase YtcJ
LIIPSGGVIDENEGIPTGILKERAVELVLSVVGKKSNEEMKSFIIDGLNLCVKMGLTAVQTNDAESLSVYKELQSENKLPVS